LTRLTHRWFGRVLSHRNFLSGVIDGKMVDKATRSRKRTELFHHVGLMEGRDYEPLKYLISDRSRWRQDSK